LAFARFVTWFWSRRLRASRTCGLCRCVLTFDGILSPLVFAHTNGDGRKDRLEMLHVKNFFTVDTFSIFQAYPDASDEEDLVEIEDIEPYASPGSILNRPTQPPAPGQTHTGDASRTKSVNPYDNVTDSPDEERRYLNVEEMREHERMSSCEYFWSCRVVRNQ